MSWEDPESDSKPFDERQDRDDAVPVDSDCWLSIAMVPAGNASAHLEDRLALLELAAIAASHGVVAILAAVRMGEDAFHCGDSQRTATVTMLEASAVDASMLPKA